MKKKNGFAEVAVLYVVIAVMGLLFIPNPVSSSLGVGIRPNKTIESDKVTLINDKDGNPIAYRQVTSNQDLQQHVTFFEWLRSLPILVLFLMGSGIFFPPIALFLHNLRLKASEAYADLTGETRRIVVSVKAGLDTIKDQPTKDAFLLALSSQQDQSTKDLVKELLKTPA